MQVSSPEFIYTTAMQAADGVPGAATFEIAQMSAAVGAGPYGKVTFDG